MVTSLRGPRGRRLAVLALSVSLLGVSGCSASDGGGSHPSATASSSSTAATSNDVKAGTSAADSTSGNLSDVPGIVQQVEPQVVTIKTKAGLGSGVVYKSDGTIVTDAHVLKDQQGNVFKTVQVLFADGKSTSATTIATDSITDVGVIKADRTGLPAAKFADSLPTVGQLAVVIGSPLGLTETVTAGIISALHRDMPPSQETPQGLFDLIQTDAPISPGNSGGAVVNADGVVVGLSEAYLPPSTGAVAIGFVSPATTVTSIADQLIKTGQAKHAYLGLRPADISQQVAQQYGLPTTQGALVVQVSSGSPADAAGIKAGDVITKLGDMKITSVTDLLGALRKVEPGATVPMTVLRGTSTKTLQVTLGNRPPATNG
ncbi:MAG: S1C family serine protease [Actinomycetales bacterium]